MGSGKSTVGALVAERAGVPFRDLDTLVERRLGMSVEEAFERMGEEGFREVESRLLPEALAGEAVAALGGGAAVAEGNWDVIRRTATSVWLDAPFPVLWARIADAGGRPLLRGRGEEDLGRLLAARAPRYALADHRVSAARPPEEVAEEVLALWRG
jgi:shikimate kinase